MDIALPCATQNELDENDARCSSERRAVRGRRREHAFDHRSGQGLRGRWRAVRPGKASNAGGVATSGLEMSQNAMRMSWTREEVDARLLQIMQGIHAACLKYGKRADGSVSYIGGANVAGFVKVADAMLARRGLTPRPHRVPSGACRSTPRGFGPFFMGVALDIPDTSMLTRWTTCQQR